MIGSNFKPLRGLDAEVVYQLLKDIADKEMSMQVMMVECRDVKVMKEIQAAFMRETGVSSWEDAMENFPGFVTADALDEFRCCNFKSGSMPARFDNDDVHVVCIQHYNKHRLKDFCQLAMKSKTNPPSTLLEQGRFTLENSKAIVTHGTTINYASASELCRNNWLDLTGAASSMINITALEEEVLTDHPLNVI